MVGLEDHLIAIRHIDNLELVVVPFGVAQHFRMCDALSNALS
jgi:hypothetical protein